MSNMSYCRFQNTVQDMHDCFYAIEEAVEQGESMDLSDDEKRAFHRMFTLMEVMMPLMEEAAEIDKELA